MNSILLKNTNETIQIPNELLGINNRHKLLEWCDENLQKDPTHQGFWLIKADAFYNMTEFNESIKCYEEIIKLNPKDSICYNSKGKAHIAINQFKEALECFNEAIKIEPKPYYYFSKANAYIVLNQFNESLQCLNEAIKIEPDNVEHYLTKVGVLTELGLRKEAQECLSLTHKYDKSNGLNMLGFNLFNQNYIDKSIMLYAGLTEEEISPLLKAWSSTYGNNDSIKTINACKESVKKANDANNLQAIKMYNVQLAEMMCKFVNKDKNISKDIIIKIDNWRNKIIEIEDIKYLFNNFSNAKELEENYQAILERISSLKITKNSKDLQQKLFCYVSLKLKEDFGDKLNDDKYIKYQIGKNNFPNFQESIKKLLNLPFQELLEKLEEPKNVESKQIEIKNVSHLLENNEKSLIPQNINIPDNISLQTISIKELKKQELQKLKNLIKKQPYGREINIDEINKLEK
jgi:tetratricopeptide (TPR) repeat protein